MLGACGGGAPLLHPAHTLPRGVVSFAAGTSGQLALGDAADAEAALADAAEQSAGAVGAERERFTQGLLARLALADGVAPYFAARAGLGGQNEAGLTYTGRSFRLDARHAFEWTNVALSAGLGASGVIGVLPRDDTPAERDDSLPPAAGLRDAEARSVRGFGLELPLLLGYRSDADVVQAWAGARLGFERSSYGVSLVTVPSNRYDVTASTTRMWAGGLVGFAVGLSPIEVRVELDAAYERVSGELDTGEGELSAKVSGLSLTPAMAISAKF